MSNPNVAVNYFHAAPRSCTKWGPILKDPLRERTLRVMRSCTSNALDCVRMSRSWDPALHDALHCYSAIHGVCRERAASHQSLSRSCLQQVRFLQECLQTTTEHVPRKRRLQVATLYFSRVGQVLEAGNKALFQSPSLGFWTRNDSFMFHTHVRPANNIHYLHL